jgi:hypothetical protein
LQFFGVGFSAFETQSKAYEQHSERQFKRSRVGLSGNFRQRFRFPADGGEPFSPKPTDIFVTPDTISAVLREGNKWPSRPSRRISGLAPLVQDQVNGMSFEDRKVGSREQLRALIRCKTKLETSST